MSTRGAVVAEPEVGSFTKSMFCGEIAEDLIFPFPALDPDEQSTVRDLVASAREAMQDYDPHTVEEEGWVGDAFLADLGERGLLGLYVDPGYGGQGLSQTGYCRVMEEFGRVDPTLAVVIGVHQSIGMKPIHLYGSEEQKERFLPDLASGRKLAAFALTEPQAGSDAYHLESWADERSDGSFVLNGEKRFIGNGSKDVVVTFARSERGHVALILERGMDGFDAPHRYDTLGLRGNDLRHLVFNDVRVPPENVLGEPGDGFKIAVETLNNGRMSLGTGAVGGTKQLIELAVSHVTEREQFGRPLADFELVEEKIAWMTSYLFGLESMAYATCGLVDRGVDDFSVESAMVKVASTEFMWYAANRAFQLAGGEAYIRPNPYEKMLRDIRIFPIFEGANDVLRAFIALMGLKGLADELEDLQHLDLTDPIRSLGSVANYVVGRVRREISPPGVTKVHPALEDLAAPLGDQVARLRQMSEKLLREHGEEIKDRQWQQERVAHAAMDIYAQIATLSRASAILAEQGAEASGQERYITETFCTRAARRVDRELGHVESNDDDRMHAIARITYRQGGYRHSSHGI